MHTYSDDRVRQYDRTPPMASRLTTTATIIPPAKVQGAGNMAGRKTVTRGPKRHIPTVFELRATEIEREKAQRERNALLIARASRSNVYRKVAPPTPSAWSKD